MNASSSDRSSQPQSPSALVSTARAAPSLPEASAPGEEPTDTAEGPAPDVPPGCEMARGWCVRVSVYGDTILAIEEQALSGLADLEPWASTIRGCAEHLQAFIGPADGAPALDAELPSLETGEADAIEPRTKDNAL
jgi:hypothetical protein